MALPMVHLLTAHAWAQDKPELLNNPDYYLGAISPDAIHIRDGSDKSRKNITHMGNWREMLPSAILNYWQNHNSAFDMGYGVHALTDGLWTVRFHRELTGMLLPNGKPDPEIYYNDTLIVDFRLFHEHPLTQFLMDMLRRGTAPDKHPLLSAHEIDAWRTDTLAFYERPCDRHAPVRFITYDYVQRFLADCTVYLNNVWERMLNMNETQKSIMNRRSTRGFSDVALTKDEMQLLADAALASPTACNYQDWHFIFLSNRSIMRQFSEDYRRELLANLSPEARAANVNYDVFFGAPLVVFITLPEAPRSRFAEVDAGIAVENLALSAQGMGLGSVILGRPRDVFDSDGGKAWQRRLGFPEGHRFAIAIAIGHNTVSKDAHPIGEGKISYID